MANRFLITRPYYDDTTSYLHEWSEDIIDIGNKKGIKPIDLSSKKATQENVERAIKKFKPKFLIFNGHGAEDKILGHEHETLIKLGENEDLLKSKIVYSRSCNSAKKLGAEIVNSDSSSSFIGYDKKFIFAVEEGRTATPKKDTFAKPFLESTNLIAISLLKGNTVEDSHKRSLESFKKNIEFYDTQKTPEAPHIAFFLKWDLFAQRALGKLDATIF